MRLAVSRETARNMIKSLDPASEEKTSARKFQHRIFRCHGPNFTWHIDEYGKLKLFGFLIHGCVNGFNQKIIRL